MNTTPEPQPPTAQSNLQPMLTNQTPQSSDAIQSQNIIPPKMPISVLDNNSISDRNQTQSQECLPSMSVTTPVSSTPVSVENVDQSVTEPFVNANSTQQQQQVVTSTQSLPMSANQPTIVSTVPTTESQSSPPRTDISSNATENEIKSISNVSAPQSSQEKSLSVPSVTSSFSENVQQNPPTQSQQQSGMLAESSIPTTNS